MTFQHFMDVGFVIAVVIISVWTFIIFMLFQLWPKKKIKEEGK
jgi:hypothetical protein